MNGNGTGNGEGPALGRVVALFADVHGSLPNLHGALERCAAAGVETIALLGDLFDRVEQADGCARALAGWHVTGVWGNHEREIALAAAELGVLDAATVAMLQGLDEELIVEDICFAHEVPRWGPDPLARLFGRGLLRIRLCPATRTRRSRSRSRCARNGACQARRKRSRRS